MPQTKGIGRHCATALLDNPGGRGRYVMQNCSYVKCEHELLFLLGTLLRIGTLLLNGHFDALFGANRWQELSPAACARITHIA